MTRATELRREISAKKTVIENLQRAGKTAEALKQADEINNLVDSLTIEEAKEKADFENFLKNPKVPAGITLDSVGITPAQKYQGGVIGDEYRKEFFNQVRTGFKNAQNYLRESSPANGGYLVPSEFHDKIISRLENENVMRQISTVVTTNNDHQVALTTSSPTASWITEGSSIPLSSEEFNRVTLSAYKLGTAVNVTNELLSDSFYDIEQHFLTEFSAVIAAKEEEAFLTGNGTTQPEGIVPAISADSDCYLTTLDGFISVDDLIKLQYSLPRQYRKNAVWLTNDKTYGEIRRLKDEEGRFIWQPSLIEGEPALLLGSPIYSSPYIPEPLYPVVNAMENTTAVLFYGDFQRFYYIAQRGELVFKPLREINALSDITSFLMLERIDGRIIDKAAVRGLKISV